MVPCFGAGCSGFDRTGAQDTEPTLPAETNPVIPKEVFPVVPKEAFPALPNKGSSVSKGSPVSRKDAFPNRISQNEGSTTTPERSTFPKSPLKIRPSWTTTSGPSRSRQPRSPLIPERSSTPGAPKTPAHQPNVSGSQIRKIHDAHRGGFRRSPRVRLSQNAIAKEVRIPIKPVPSLMSPSDSASKSKQPVASKVPATPSRPGRRRPVSEANKQTTSPTLAGTEPLPPPSESNKRVHKPIVPPAQITCDCQPSALRILEELETRNHQMQDYTGSAISQHLTQCMGKCVGILECKRCMELSEQMMLMIIIAQKITKMFSRLATRFIEQSQSILSSESSIPLPRLVLIQQLKLEKVLNLLTAISTNHGWQTHLAILDPICQYSLDTMDRLRRMNGLSRPLARNKKLQSF